jgi:hypothetical protein
MALALMCMGLVPGLLPAVILASALCLVLVAPLLVFGLTAALVFVPPYAIWRLMRRSSNSRREDPKPQRSLWPDDRILAITSPPATQLASGAFGVGQLRADAEFAQLLKEIRDLPEALPTISPDLGEH